MFGKFLALFRFFISFCVVYSLGLAATNYYSEYYTDAFWCLGLTIVNAQFLLITSTSSASN